MRSAVDEPHPEGFRFTHAALLYLVATLVVFGDVLYGSGQVVSRWDIDLSHLFLGLRDFGFRELSHGHLALWNPHFFCGSPFFAGFQSALLYPPNWLYLIMPATRAVNLDVALHVWLSGLFAYAWPRHGKLHPAACVMAGLVFMFGGPHFLHVYAGHLAQLCTITWAPLVLLGIDGAIDAEPADRPRSVLLGGFALAMRILAGFPQLVLYLGVVTVPYVLFRIASNRRADMKLTRTVGVRAGALLLLVVVGLGLAAVQWVAGAGVVGESARRHLPWVIASSFFLPPENLLTLVAPGFFGNMSNAAPYWGQCYLWEAMLFVGLTPLVFALYGAIRGPARQGALAMVLLVLSLLLAFGPLTPLFRFVYDVIPAGDGFRGPSKFTLPALCWLTMLAATGLHHALTHGRLPRALPCAVAAAAIFILVAAGLIHHSCAAGATGLWGRTLLRLPWANYGRYMPKPDAAALARYGFQAAAALDWAAATLAVLAALLFVAHQPGPRARRVAIAGLLGLTAAELLTFARCYRPTFGVALLDQEESALAAIVARLPPDARVLYDNQTEVLGAGAETVWADDADGPAALPRHGPRPPG
jgi:hypothetical protein